MAAITGHLVAGLVHPCHWLWLGDDLALVTATTCHTCHRTPTPQETIDAWLYLGASPHLGAGECVCYGTFTVTGILLSRSAVTTDMLLDACAMLTGGLAELTATDNLQPQRYSPPKRTHVNAAHQGHTEFDVDDFPPDDRPVVLSEASGELDFYGHVHDIPHDETLCTFLPAPRPYTRIDDRLVARR